MPYKRRSTRSTTKRTARRKYVKRSRSRRTFKRVFNQMTSGSPLQKWLPFKTSHVVNLPWIENTAVGTVVGVPTAYVLRANSPYDPRYNSGGQSAYYYDTFCGADEAVAPYYRYKVLSCMYHIEFFNANSTSTTPCRFALTLTEDITALPVDIEQAMLDPNTKVSPVINTISSGKAVTSLKGNIIMSKFFGKGQYTDKDLVAPYNADPAKVCYAVIQPFPIDEGTVTATYITNVRLVFKILFMDRNTVVQS